MSTLLNFVTFDIINTDPIYDGIFGADDTSPLNDHFYEAGYVSTDYIRNIGSLFLFIWIGLGLGISGLLILKIKKLPEKMRKKI